MIESRPLKKGEELLWMSLGSFVSSGRIDSDDITVALAREDPRSFLIALDGTRCVGRLRGRFLNPRLYFIRELVASEGAGSEEVAKSLCGFLAGSFSADGTEILGWDRPEDDATNSAMEAVGFVVGRRKVFVERNIAEYESPYEDDFTYKTLAELGEERFLELMARASEGDPFEDSTARDTLADFRELVDYAGDKFDPTWWRAAYRNGTPVGVVLPQEFADRDAEGSLFYVGVLPQFRGHGYGKRLHAAGLEFMARNGIEHYVGSTDSRNMPMLAVFAANECKSTGTQLFYKALKKRSTEA